MIIKLIVSFDSSGALGIPGRIHMSDMACVCTHVLEIQLTEVIKELQLMEENSQWKKKMMGRREKVNEGKIERKKYKTYSLFDYKDNLIYNISYQLS